MHDPGRALATGSVFAKCPIDDLLFRTGELITLCNAWKMNELLSFHITVPCLPFCSPPTLRNGFWVSVSMTTSPPLSTTMRSPRTPVPLVTLTPQQAGLSARCCSGGVYAWMCHSCLSVLFFFFFDNVTMAEGKPSFIHSFQCYGGRHHYNTWCRNPIEMNNSE